MVRVGLSVKLKRHGVDCGPTVGRIGPWTRADRSRMGPHLGHNLDTGAKPIQRWARRARDNLWPRSLASEGRRNGPRRCRDGGQADELSRCPERPHARRSKLWLICSPSLGMSPSGRLGIRSSSNSALGDSKDRALTADGIVRTRSRGHHTLPDCGKSPNGSGFRQTVLGARRRTARRSAGVDR
jgi:hypothetical protein